MVLDFHAPPFQLEIEYLLYQRPAAPAAGARAGLLLQGAKAGTALRHGIYDLRLRDAVAGADQRTVWQQADALPRPAAFPSRKEQVLRVLRQRERVEHALQQRAVVRGVADEDRAEQLLAVGGHGELLVDNLVGVDVAHRARAAAMGVTDRGDVDAHQF